MNTLVSFEISKLLKEKGFNELCSHLYFDKEQKKVTIQKVSYDDTLSSRYYIAPTIAEVIMWLYEKHGIWIDVTLSRNKKQYTFMIQSVSFDADKFLNEYYDSPIESYEAAIIYTLKNLLG